MLLLLLRRAPLLAWLFALAPFTSAATPNPADIDKLFAAWEKSDSPGLALAVVKDGKIVHSRGYGQASLEYGIPIKPSTVFHAASLSKQFTGFAIQLLAQEGKLSLDDPVKKYVPQLQVEGPPITIRHLLHHTSGLRDQWDLLTLAGLRLEDTITESDILGLVFQQKQLNFQPGADHLYSNTGYTLLGQIVQRVSGESLAAFAQDRIFKPLGMKSTHFQENYGTVVKNRAYSYARGRDGNWRYVALSYSNTGATSIFTTVEDLALWNANFDQPRAGSAETVQASLVTGKTNDGRDTNYASGHVVSTYRGVPSIAHTGSDAGYRAYFLRLPQQKLAVMILGNAAELEAAQLGQRVADLYIAGEPGVQPPRPFPAEVEVPAADLAAFAGDYEATRGRVVSFFVQQGRLFLSTGGPPTPLFASGANHFFAKTGNMTMNFTASPGNGPSPTAVWKVGEVELALRRLVRESPSPEMVRACAGDFYSPELRTIYTLETRNGKLLLRHPRGVLELRAINRDIWIAGYPLGIITMKRGAAGGCESLETTTARVRNLQFQRMK
jgi:CubicO group peptidase (beta-lactamase class C family)